MLEWLKDSDQSAVGRQTMTRKFAQMLEDGRHVFDAASSSLLGGSDPELIRRDLFDTDKRINQLEQEIRRALVVHGSVHGAGSVPGLLVMMSVVKDAERIGDYAKNLFDLCVHARNPFGPQERAQLLELKGQISLLLAKARNIYDRRDETAALRFLEECNAIEDRCDAAVHAALSPTGSNLAATVLTFRYFKRVVSHASNIVTSLVQPLHMLDFFAERKAP